jgi:hypothetical protein
METLFDLVSDTPEEEMAKVLRMEQLTVKMWHMHRKPIPVTARSKA